MRDSPVDSLRTPVRLLTILAAAIAALGQTGARAIPVATETLVGASAVRPGQSIRLALKVDLPAGFHVQSNAPRERSYIPTSIVLQPPE